MKRKARSQPSLAPLSELEKEQLADWLRQETYETVQARVTKPRSEGGFDLKISVRPLQIYHAKVQKLDMINARLTDGKKLTLGDLESIDAAERRVLPSDSRLSNLRSEPGGDLAHVSDEVHTAWS